MAEKNEKTKTRTREIIDEWRPRILFLVIGLVLGLQDSAQRGLDRIRRLHPTCLRTSVLDVNLPRSGQYCPVRRQPFAQ